MEFKTKKQIKNDEKRARQRETKENKKNIKAKKINDELKILIIRKEIFAENFDVKNFEKTTIEIIKLEKELKNLR